MVKMLSLARHIYAGRVLFVGDAFEAEAKFVPTLVALGRARVVEDEQPTAALLTAERGKRRRTYETRDLSAE
jgi:hypothetical protein